MGRVDTLSKRVKSRTPNQLTLNFPYKKRGFKYSNPLVCILQVKDAATTVKNIRPMSMPPIIANALITKSPFNHFVV
jgi:hypothetical protein